MTGSAPVIARPIFLIGYRGTGKTTIARLLAERLGWAWVDADAELEVREGRSIRQIIAAEGETGFRDREAVLFAELCRLQRHVIATGGGVVLREANRAAMRAAGLVVWLTADAETLWQRLQADPATAERRPALSVGGRAEIEEALCARKALYRDCADCTLVTAGQSPEEIVRAIMALPDFATMGR